MAPIPAAMAVAGWGAGQREMAGSRRKAVRTQNPEDDNGTDHRTS